MRRLFLLALFSLSLLMGCSRGEAPSGTGNSLADLAAPAAPAGKLAAVGVGGTPQEALPARGEAAAPRRYLAVRHALRIQTEADRVESAWQQANKACEAAGCEMLSSSLTRDERRRPANAQREARVPPEKLDAFLKQVSALGSVGQHSRHAEDKTDEVIDTEASLKNMSELRENLRRLLAKPGAKLSDLIEVERELARVQTELDSLASRRKALASLTDKVHVSIAFMADPEYAGASFWEPVRDSAADAGHVLAVSLAGLITFAAAVLPWTLVLLIAAGAGRALWRRRRAARQRTVRT